MNWRGVTVLTQRCNCDGTGELPLESRWHAIQAFNKGLFDILIATDDPRLMAARGAAAQARDRISPRDRREIAGRSRGDRGEIAGIAEIAEMEPGSSPGAAPRMRDVQAERSASDGMFLCTGGVH